MGRRLSRLICGGAGWTKNAERRDLIERVKDHLEQWRDFDDPAHLAAARRILNEEAA